MQFDSNNKVEVEQDTSAINFCLKSEDWVMRISEQNGIEFNRKYFSNASPDQFALKVIEILECCITVKFERKT